MKANGTLKRVIEKNGIDSVLEAVKELPPAHRKTARYYIRKLVRMSGGPQAATAEYFGCSKQHVSDVVTALADRLSD